MGRFVRVVAVVGLVLLMASPASAQEDEIQILSVDTTDQPTIELVVAIPPSLGEVPANESFFALTEAGQRRAISVESLRDSVDVILVIDTSGSMRGAPLAAAKVAASRFVDELPDGARIGVVGFGAEPTVASPMGVDRSANQQAIASLSASGETALWEAMVVASGLLAEANSDQPYIVLLSDGGNTVDGTTRSDAVRAVSATGAPLYAVALETTESNHSELRSTVDDVGGQFLGTGDTSELAALYSDVAGRLTSRYLVRFEAQGSGESTAVLSVAIDDRIALARTVLDLAGGEAATAAEAPVALSTAAVPAELGLVVVPEPGLLAQPWVLWVGAVSFFVAAFLVATMFSLPSVRVRELGSRASEGASRVDAARAGLTRSADRLVARRDSEGSLDLALDAAGINLRAGEFVVLAGSATAVVALLGSVNSGVAGAAAMTLLGIFVSVTIVKVRVSRRRAKFSDQLSDTISIIVGSLRSGRGLPQALELVAQESQKPSSDEFRRVVVEARVGRDQVQSLEAMANRMDNPDVVWIAQAIAINRELGGDLVEVLENVAETIRSRTRVHRQVRALSAEGRLSGWFMVATPFLLFLYMRAVNPDYVEPLITTGTGNAIIAVGLVLIALGALWIRKLIDLKY